MEYSKNIALEAAVKKSDIDEVHRLLEQGASPNYRPRCYESLMHLASTKKQPEVIKLLARYGATVDPNLIKCIFYSQSIDYFQEVVFYMLKCNTNIKFIQTVFKELVYNLDYAGPKALWILALLLKHGLPIDDYTDDYSCSGFTPLLNSVDVDRIHFVRILIL